MASYTIHKQILLNASKENIWNALTNPDIISKYLFGAEVISKWKIGSKILYKGNFNGTRFEDKGEITAFDPYKCFQYRYWSENHGTKNVKSNYVTITYQITEKGSSCILDIFQENYKSQIIVNGMNTIWDTIIEQLKFVLEN